MAQIRAECAGQQWRAHCRWKPGIPYTPTSTHTHTHTHTHTRIRAYTRAHTRARALVIRPRLLIIRACTRARTQKRPANEQKRPTNTLVFVRIYGKRDLLMSKRGVLTRLFLCVFLAAGFFLLFRHWCRRGGHGEERAGGRGCGCGG